MKQHRTIIFLVVLIALAALWFLGVDLSLFIEGCDNCLYQRDVIQYRLFTIPIHERTDEVHPPIELIARDLGAPCPHHSFYRWHKQRLWGLCYCAWPCISGITGLSSDSDPWYTDDLKAKLKSSASADPTLGEEFLQRVIYDHDWNYWRRFQLELSNDKVEQIVLSASSLSEDDLRKIANRIQLIEWLELKPGKVQTDENAAVVLALGEKVAPYLVEKITDQQLSQWLAWAKVGDVAHMVLGVIYNRTWPTSQFADSHNLKWNESYRSYYLKFLNLPDDQKNLENRNKLQQAWKQVVEKRRKIGR